MNKKESKYFSTAEKMDKALLELLEKKDFEYITIKEICDKAGVNRSTFYLHYENTVDLLQEATRYVLDEFFKYFVEYNAGTSLNPEKSELSELVFVRPEYVVPYLTYIKENQRVFKTSLKHLRMMGFDSYYEKLFLYVFNPILERFNVPASERQYVMKFYLTGVTAIAMEWLKNGCSDPIDTISDIIIKCASRQYEQKGKN